MCNAYHTACNPEELGSRTCPDQTRLIRPTDPAPVILPSGEIVTMRWGFQRKGLGTINNTRSDKLDSPMWREATARRRCLIPVISFYEWTGPTGHKQTHLFHHPGNEWLQAAGIWEESAGQGPCFSMLTTQANSLVAPIHHRMPALLSESEQNSYLSEGLPSFEPAPDLLVTKKVANPLAKNRPNHVQDELF